MSKFQTLKSPHAKYRDALVGDQVEVEMNNKSKEIALMVRAASWVPPGPAVQIDRLSSLEGILLLLHFVRAGRGNRGTTERLTDVQSTQKIEEEREISRRQPRSRREVFLRRYPK